MKIVLVIDEKNRDIANEFCNTINAEGETFSVPLFNSKEELISYWAGWNVNEYQLYSIQSNPIFEIFNNAQEALEKTGLHPATSIDN